MLQAENIFTRPKDEQAAADSKKAKFNQPEGDQLSYLEVYRQWTENNFNSAWCRKNFVNAKAMRKAQVNIYMTCYLFKQIFECVSRA